ncbi:MAG: response regulator [Alcaligenaceae bacterium]|nr:MAG: response regulator [Alcaligenaceae bacterium]
MTEVDDRRPFALVADDDDLIRMAAAAILEDAGFRPLEAASVEDALAVLHDQGSDIQLLFTDVHMPPGELTGFDLARACSKGWPHIGILVSSGQATPGPGDLPNGAVFISKPFTSDVVYDRLQEILPDGAKPEPLRRRAK